MKVTDTGMIEDDVKEEQEVTEQAAETNETSKKTVGTKTTKQKKQSKAVTEKKENVLEEKEVVENKDVEKEIVSNKETMPSKPAKKSKKSKEVASEETIQITKPKLSETAIEKLENKGTTSKSKKQTKNPIEGQETLELNKKDEKSEKTSKIVKEVEEIEKVIIEEQYNYNDYMGNMKKTGSNKKVLVISTISVVLFLIIVILSTGFALLNINNRGMMSGIMIMGVDVQGLTKEQTTQKIAEMLNKQLEKEINLQQVEEEFEYSLLPTQIEAKYKIEEAVDTAYLIGRSSNIFANNFAIMKSMIKGNEIDIEFGYNDELLSEIILDIIAKMPDTVMEPSHYREDGNKLIISKGQVGNSIESTKTKELIVDKIKNNDEKFIVLTTIHAEPKAIDIDKIYKEVHTEPQDAYYVAEPFQVFAHVEGVTFDIEVARELLKEDKEEYEISLIITLPEITTNKIGPEAFPDLLARFSTRYDASLRGRSENLRLSAAKIDGVVVMPGEVFSYNKVVGKRTIEAGYSEAMGYIGGRVVPTLGGGICQISSTLYNAVIYANLEVVERRNHMFLTSYLGAGKDATVAWGSIDFKFKNTRDYPIMLKTSVQNGVANIDIFGLREDIEYDIEIVTTILYSIPFSVLYETDYGLATGQERVSQGGMNGCKSSTYKVIKFNGVEISRELLSTDHYDPMNKIIQRGPAATYVPPPEPAPEPEPWVPVSDIE